MSARDDAIVGAAWAALHDDPKVFDMAMFDAALSAAGFVVEQDWQPIETAPRDGTWIWCWHEEKRWKRVGMRCKASGPRWYYSGTGFNAEYADDAPTHWRPLPAAPQEDK